MKLRLPSETPVETAAGKSPARPLRTVGTPENLEPVDLPGPAEGLYAPVYRVYPGSRRRLM